MASFVEQLFDISSYTKGLGGVLGKFYGQSGKTFGGQGAEFGYLGEDQIPKAESNFQLSDYFDLKAHFDIQKFFDPVKLSDAVLSGAVHKSFGG